jgi:hypothetical protein
MNVRLKVVFGIFAVAALSFFLSAYFSLQRDAPAIAPQFSSSTAPDRVPVVARAWLESNQVKAGQRFNINFEFQNNSVDDVHELAIESLDSGSAMRLNDCFVARDDGREVVIPDHTFPPAVTLPKGATGRFRCELTPSRATGAYSLAAVYAFTAENPDGVRFHNAVVIGPLHVTAPLLEQFLAVGIPFQTVITALILPICLGLLAWYLPHLEAAKKERDRQLAEETAQAQQTWNLLLPHSLESAQKYYLPACSAILRMQRFAKPPGDRRKVFYTLLLLMRNMRACRDEIGGLHFKNRLGESIAASWWNAVNFLLVTTFPLEVSEAALDCFGTRESYSQFIARFENPQTQHVFRQAEDVFNGWYMRPAVGAGEIRPFRDYLPLFLMFREVLRFELNRPLQYWYGKLDDSKALEEALKGIENLGLKEIPGWEGPEGLVLKTRAYAEAVKLDVARGPAISPVLPLR